MMEQELLAELYLSFGLAFQRPNREVADHLDEFLELWAEVLSDRDERVRGLTEFCHRYPLGEERLNALWEHYIPLFETGAVEAPPYASVYLGDEGWVLGREALAVKEFYGECGYEMGGGELPDHLAVELEFCSVLARNGRGPSLGEFTAKHLTPFLTAILPKIRRAQRPFYSEVAGILEILHKDMEKAGDSVG